MASKIEQQVMASVAALYAARQLTSATALKLYVCVLALFGIAKLVWVARVFENLANVGTGKFFEFIFVAVVNTDVWVQVALVVLAVAGVGLIRDLLRLSPRLQLA